MHTTNTLWIVWIEKNGKQVSAARLFTDAGLSEQARRFEQNGPVSGLRMVFQKYTGIGTEWEAL